MATVETQFQDFEPSIEWIEEEDSQTFVVYLPGFRKDQLKVQVTSTGALKISGERRLSGQNWTRFRQECSIPADCEINAISARFQEGMLYVKLPKKTTPKPQQEIEEELKPTTQTPNPNDHQKPLPTDHHPHTNERINDNDNANAGGFSRKTKKTDEKKLNEKVDKSGGDHGLGEAGKLAGASGFNEVIKAGKYKESAAELVKEMKKPKKVMNLVVAVLMGIVLLLYVTNAIRSLLGNPKSTVQDQ